MEAGVHHDARFSRSHNVNQLVYLQLLGPAVIIRSLQDCYPCSPIIDVNASDQEIVKLFIRRVYFRLPHWPTMFQ